ncbi:hypothetical protein SDC9_189370 [bioreactor metagenome]|uniref:Uncharacterized protein n=1 Tax=bioreactor metagenome TaxID=1076179 RepID=A0A645HRY9_9ZZZZ
MMFEAMAIFLYGLRSHHLTHIASAGRITHHCSTIPEQNDGGMSVFLHIHHDYDLHEMPHVQRVCSRIKSYVELYFFPAKHTAYLFFLGALLDEASFLQHIKNITMFAYIISDKIHVFSSTGSVFFRWHQVQLPAYPAAFCRISYKTPLRLPSLLSKVFCPP